MRSVSITQGPKPWTYLQLIRSLLNLASSRIPWNLRKKTSIQVRATPSAGTEDATGPAPISVSAVFTIVLAASSLAGNA
ncbi:hypothetical protein AB205_0000820 [Aquarana catesbeiana]|uniref:Uncharacterized protein n=1 Tax=Aquarana catesbeiana TaxID=8400 RepID=A0A2G9SKQ5_AQUCT|nr:hypothetical protein AB205_0000820 [Aquarana catesbeiana]